MFQYTYVLQKSVSNIFQSTVTIAYKKDTNDWRLDENNSHDYLHSVSLYNKIEVTNQIAMPCFENFDLQC